MATENSTETLQKLSVTLGEAYQAMLEVNTMLETLMEAHSEETSGHMCSIILEQNRDVSGVLEFAARDISNLAGAS